MLALLIILFAFSLVSVVVTERLRTLNQLLALQGLLLCGIALLSLKHLDALHLGFIMLETVLVKSIFVPRFMDYLQRKHNYKGQIQATVPGFVSLLGVSFVIVLTFLLVSAIEREPLMVKYLTAAIAAGLTGLYMMAIHRQIIVHLLAYVVLENGIFLLSLTVGQEMPILINGAILLDVFTTLLALGIFASEIGSKYDDFDADRLKELKD